MRRVFLVGVFMLVMLALATHTTAAQAAVTQTVITSPSDPAYFYDPTGGLYGGVAVTGSTNSTSPASDQVDIDCYTDDGNAAESDGGGGYYIGTLATASLDAGGNFSTTVPYSAIEQYATNGECRLRAVPSGANPPVSGLSSFAGPRLLLAYLKLNYTFGSPSALDDYALNAPQLGAVDTYSAASDPFGTYLLGNTPCGLGMSLASAQYFSDTAYSSFTCADPIYNADSGTGGIDVDGQLTSDSWDTGEPLTVAVTQDPTNGDVTIHETQQLDFCPSNCVSSGVQDDRTIQQAADGRVSMITDDFVSTDGASHQVDFASSNAFDNGAYSGNPDVFELPGESSFSSHSAGDTVTVGAGVPGTIYGYNPFYSDGTDAGYDALTYFTAPSGPVSFAQNYLNTPGNPVGTAVVPFTLSVPAGGSKAVSIAYASEYSQAALAGDLQTELDLQTAPTVTISSPSAGASVSSAHVAVTGSVSAFTGVKSVSVNGVAATVSGGSFSAAVPLVSGSNTITAVVTTDSGITASATETVSYNPSSPGTPIKPAVQGSIGAVWLPIANTGSARHVSAHKELLRGTVTAGSGAVSYYFQYGSRGHLNHRSKAVSLAAGKTSRNVTLTIGALSGGTRYTYRLVATGTYGHAAGRSRTFKTTAHTK